MVSTFKMVLIYGGKLYTYNTFFIEIIYKYLHVDVFLLKKALMWRFSSQITVYIYIFTVCIYIYMAQTLYIYTHTDNISSLKQYQSYHLDNVNNHLNNC